MEITLYQIACLIGIPSLFGSIYAWCIQKFHKTNDELKALKKGMQALLRSQMVMEYNSWSKQGYAPLHAKDNFENMYAIYHSLGANGVMNEIHEQFMDLPNCKLD